MSTEKIAIQQSFSWRLKIARMSSRQKARDIAEKCGISAAYYSQLETGARDNPSDELVNKLAVACDSTIDWLLGRADITHKVKRLTMSHLPESPPDSKNDTVSFLPDSNLPRMSNLPESPPDSKNTPASVDLNAAYAAELARVLEPRALGEALHLGSGRTRAVAQYREVSREWLEHEVSELLAALPRAQAGRGRLYLIRPMLEMLLELQERELDACTGRQRPSPAAPAPAAAKAAGEAGGEDGVEGEDGDGDES